MTQLEKALNKLPITKPLRKELYRGIISNNLTKVTWKELKDLRDNSQLVPGCWYRMTDYECIINTAIYKSAGHQFDLLILATDVNKLSEQCQAMRHNGDTYFPEDTKFEEWEVKYCIDNDFSRFTWAEEGGHKIKGDLYLDFSALGGGVFSEKNGVVPLISTTDTEIEGFPYKCELNLFGYNIPFWFDSIEGNANVYLKIDIPGILPPGVPSLLGPFPAASNLEDLGICPPGKGIIYHLKDEKNNSVPYDFKNLKFARYKIIENPELENDDNPCIGFWAHMSNGNVVTEPDPVYFYTFSTLLNNGTIIDNSTLQNPYAVAPDYSKDNTITSYTTDNNFKKYLLDNVFIDDNIYDSVESGYKGVAQNNTINGYSNTFGSLLCCNLMKECCSNIITEAFYFTANGDMWNNLIWRIKTTTVGNQFTNNKIVLLTNSTVGDQFVNSKILLPKDKSCYGVTIGNNTINLTIKSNTHIVGNTVLNNLHFTTEHIVELNGRVRQFILRKGNGIAVYDISNLIPESAIIE